jgi:hypothetical protein
MGAGSKITLEWPLSRLTAASHVIDMRIDKKKSVPSGLTVSTASYFLS